MRDMTQTSEQLDAVDERDLRALDVAWDLETLLDGSTVDELLDQADALAGELEKARGTLADIDASQLVDVMQRFGAFEALMGRAGSYAGLRFAEDSLDESRGALMAKMQERATTIASRLLFYELEWAALSDERVEELLADDRLAFCAHH